MNKPDYTKLRGPQFTEKHFKFHYPEFLEYINAKYPQISNFQERLYWDAYGLTKFPTCYCGAPVVFEGFGKGYRKYCSRKCMNSDPIKKEAVKQTNIKRYGGVAPAASPAVKQKSRETCIRHYGVENPLQNEFIKEKVFGTITKKYGVPNPCLLHPTSAMPSSQEHIIRSWLDEWGVEYTANNRTIIPPKELDIYIPTKHIAIECNGCYWHSDAEKPKDYHIKKFQECQNNDIQLIQIWEDWMINKPEIVKSFLQAKLGICHNTYYARQCEVKEIDYHTAMGFLEFNHIQGRCSSNYRIGLYYNNDLVAVMCFNKRSALSGPKTLNSREAELIRFCNLRNTRVIGGAGKLLKYYIKKFNPSIITSYSANDISNGQLYKSLGFQSTHKISESYWYIEPITFKRQHRSIYTRSGIVRRWPEYDINDMTWTERSVMDSKGYMRIHDSGTTKWILTI